MSHRQVQAPSLSTFGFPLSAASSDTDLSPAPPNPFRLLTVPLRLSPFGPTIPVHFHIDDTFQGIRPLHVALSGSGRNCRARIINADNEDAPWHEDVADVMELFPGGRRWREELRWNWKVLLASVFAILLFLILNPCIGSLPHCPKGPLLSRDLSLSYTSDNPAGLNRFYGIKARTPRPLPEATILQSMKTQPLTIFDDLISATDDTQSILTTLLNPSPYLFEDWSLSDRFRFFGYIATSVSNIQVLTYDLALITAQPYYVGDPEHRLAQDIYGPVKAIIDVDVVSLIRRFLEKWFRLNAHLATTFSSSHLYGLAELTLELGEASSASQALGQLHSFFESGTSSPCHLLKPSPELPTVFLYGSFSAR